MRTEHPRAYEICRVLLENCYKTPTELLLRGYSTPVKNYSKNDQILKFPPPMYLSRPTGGYHLLPVLPPKMADLLPVSYNPLKSDRTSLSVF